MVPKSPTQATADHDTATVAATARLALAAATGMLGLATLAATAGSTLTSLGRGYAGAVHIAPQLLLRGSALFVVVAALLALIRRYRPALAGSLSSRFYSNGLTIPSGQSQWLLVAVGCLSVILFFDLQNFVHGFFRLDDYDYLRIAREEPLLQQLLTPHGQHTVPLLRLEYYVLDNLFGPNPLAFNLANLVGSLGLLLAGCWLLAEIGVGWLGLASFVWLNWFWPGWSDFTSGYYSNSSYYQGVGLGFVALACLFRATRGGKIWLLGSTLALAGAIFLGVVSAWLFVALPLFAAAAFTAHPDARRLWRLALAAYTAVAGLFIAYALIAFHGVPAVETASDVNVMRELTSFLSGLGGLFLSFLLPIQAGSLASFGIVRWLEFAALLTVAWIFFVTLRRASARDRRVLVAGALVIATQIAMVAFARKPAEAGFFWHAKWLGIAHCTAALIFGLLVDRYFRGLRIASHVSTLKWWSCAAILSLWLAHAVPEIQSAMGAKVGRPANLRHALLRHAELTRFRVKLEVVASALGEKPVLVPLCSAEKLLQVFPLFELYPLPDILSALPPGLTRVAPAGTAVPVRTAQALQSVPEFRQLFFAPSP